MPAYKALLTLDLSQESPDQKALFHQTLKAATWQQLAQMETAWRCSWSDIEYEKAVAEIKADVDKAALAAGIQRYPYAFQLGTNPVKVF